VLTAFSWLAKQGHGGRKGRCCWRKGRGAKKRLVGRACLTGGCSTYECTPFVFYVRLIGLARTIYIRCIYGIFCRDLSNIRTYTAYIYGSGQPYRFTIAAGVTKQVSKGSVAFLDDVWHARCVHCIHHTLCTPPAPYSCRGLQGQPQKIVCFAFIAHCAHSLLPITAEASERSRKSLLALYYSHTPYNCRGLQGQPQKIVCIAFIAHCAHSQQLQMPPRLAAKDCVHCIHRTLCTLPTTAEASKASRKRLCALHSSHIVHTPYNCRCLQG